MKTTVVAGAVLILAAGTTTVIVESSNRHSQAKMQPVPATEEPFQRESIVRLTQAKQWAMFCIMYAADHKNQLPGNFPQMKTYSDQYVTEIKNMELAKKIYNKTLTKYKEGVSTSIDLTQIQNQYLATQGNYFNVILQLLNANSNLNKALGN